MYARGCIFGEFDRLHDGHKHAIQQALLVCEELYIDIIESPANLLLEDYETRNINLTNYIKELSGKITIIKYKTLDDAIADGCNLKLDAILCAEKDLGDCWNTHFKKLEEFCDKAEVRKPEVYSYSTIMDKTYKEQVLSADKLRIRATKPDIGIDPRAVVVVK